jgi:hypothetical protein
MDPDRKGQISRQTVEKPVVSEKPVPSYRRKELLDREKKQKCSAQPWKPTPKALRRPIIVVGRNDPVRDLKDALGELREPRLAGIRARVFINAQEELQILGCGQRVVTIQLRGKTVLLHHNGNTATMKRPAFKEFLARNKDARLRGKRKLRPRFTVIEGGKSPKIEQEAA